MGYVVQLIWSYGFLIRGNDWLHEGRKLVKLDYFFDSQNRSDNSIPLWCHQFLHVREICYTNKGLGPKWDFSVPQWDKHISLTWRNWWRHHNEIKLSERFFLVRPASKFDFSMPPRGINLCIAYVTSISDYKELFWLSAGASNQKFFIIFIRRHWSRFCNTRASSYRVQPRYRAASCFIGKFGFGCLPSQVSDRGNYALLIPNSLNWND